MNLKIGQILKYKNTGFTREVLDVYGNSVLLSIVMDSDKQVYTFKEIENVFILPEEEWEPEINNYYWFINSQGFAERSYWMNEGFDNNTKNFLGVYRTPEDAEKALKDIKNKLGK